VTQREAQTFLQRVMAPMVVNIMRRRPAPTAASVTRQLMTAADAKVFEESDGAFSCIGVQIGTDGSVTYLLAGDQAADAEG
jgi:hypothetical protein